jgi:hypothetical protein
MPIRFLLTAILACGLGSAFVPGSVASQAADRTSRNADDQDCGRYQVQFGEDEVALGEEQVDVPRGSVERITARTRNGGVLVVGWDGDAYRVKACKAAGGNTMAEARARLAAMSLRVDQGALSVSEPSDGPSVVHYVVLAPRDGAVMLRATNGPLSLRGFSGTADLETQNGPISIVRAAGRIAASAVNGPVSIKGASGNITAHTQNGPVAVSLADGRWEGEQLVASTQNGPLSVDVPDSYGSGVEVRMGRHSPFRCASEACRGDERRTWDDDGRRVVLGTSDLAVKVSTQNGPVTIGATADRK